MPDIVPFPVRSVNDEIAEYDRTVRMLTRKLRTGREEALKTLSAYPTLLAGGGPDALRVVDLAILHILSRMAAFPMATTSAVLDAYYYLVPEDKDTDITTQKEPA